MDDSPPPGPRDPAVDLVLDAQAELGEGPVWDDGSRTVVWVDILGQSIHRTDPRSGADRVITLSAQPGMVALDTNGGVVAALPSTIARIGVDGSESAIASIPHDPAAFRMNDGKVDPWGRLWVGSIGWQAEPGLASLYRIDPDGSVVATLDDLTIPNGIAWSPDQGTMYYVDTMARRIDAFDLDGVTGALTDRRAVIAFDEADGYPDGMAVDAEGCLWVAMWDGGCVRRISPDGRPDRIVMAGTPRPTSCAFGGPGLETLYITSARVGIDPELAAETQAGGLFSVDVGVRGLPGNRFAG